jgi:hypothetical protein
VPQLPMTERLPAHVEVGGLIRLAQTHGGFASVLHKGEREAGTILLIITERGVNPRFFERLPNPDGSRGWSIRTIQNIESKDKFEEYLTRRQTQDPDLWIVELDIANGERLIGLG